MSDSLRRVNPVSPHFIGVREAPRKGKHPKRHQDENRRSRDLEADTDVEEEGLIDSGSKHIDIRI
jgi:hypothetical protein